MVAAGVCSACDGISAAMLGADNSVQLAHNSDLGIVVLAGNGSDNTGHSNFILISITQLIKNSLDLSGGLYFLITQFGLCKNALSDSIDLSSVLVDGCANSSFHFLYCHGLVLLLYLNLLWFLFKLPNHDCHIYPTTGHFNYNMFLFSCKSLLKK